MKALIATIHYIARRLDAREFITLFLLILSNHVMAAAVNKEQVAEAADYLGSVCFSDQDEHKDTDKKFTHMSSRDTSFGRDGTISIKEMFGGWKDFERPSYMRQTFAFQAGALTYPVELSDPFPIERNKGTIYVGVVKLRCAAGKDCIQSSGYYDSNSTPSPSGASTQSSIDITFRCMEEKSRARMLRALNDYIVGSGGARRKASRY